MSEQPETKSAKAGNAFSREVGAKAARKLRARKSNQGVWFGLGMMGQLPGRHRTPERRDVRGEQAQSVERSGILRKGQEGHGHSCGCEGQSAGHPSEAWRRAIPGAAPATRSPLAAAP